MSHALRSGVAAVRAPRSTATASAATTRVGARQHCGALHRDNRTVRESDPDDIVGAEHLRIREQCRLDGRRSRQVVTGVDLSRHPGDERVERCPLAPNQVGRDADLVGSAALRLLAIARLRKEERDDRDRGARDQDHRSELQRERRASPRACQPSDPSHSAGLSRSAGPGPGRSRKSQPQPPVSRARRRRRKAGSWQPSRLTRPVGPRVPAARAPAVAVPRDWCPVTSSRPVAMVSEPVGTRSRRVAPGTACVAATARRWARERCGAV